MVGSRGPGADEEPRLFEVPKVLGSAVERVLEDRRAELETHFCAQASICGSEMSWSAKSSDWVNSVFMVTIGAFPWGTRWPAPTKRRSLRSGDYSGGSGTDLVGLDEGL